MAKKVKSCLVCAQKECRGWGAIVTPLKPIKVTPQIFWRVHFDLLGPLPKSAEGNRYISLGVCAFSKFVEAQRNDIFYVAFYVEKSLHTNQPETIYTDDNTGAPCILSKLMCLTQKLMCQMALEIPFSQALAFTSR